MALGKLRTPALHTLCIRPFTSALGREGGGQAPHNNLKNRDLQRRETTAANSQGHSCPVWNSTFSSRHHFKNKWSPDTPDGECQGWTLPLLYDLVDLVEKMKGERILPHSLMTAAIPNVKTKDTRKNQPQIGISHQHTKRPTKHCERQQWVRRTIYHNKMRFNSGKQVWSSHWKEVIS